MNSQRLFCSKKTGVKCWYERFLVYKGYFVVEELAILFQLSSLQYSFDTNISRQLLDYQITFVNSHHENKKSKGDLVLRHRFETFVLKIFGIQNLSQKYINDYLFRAMTERRQSRVSTSSPLSRIPEIKVTLLYIIMTPYVRYCF